VRNEEVLYRVKEERNILHATEKSLNWIGNILSRNRRKKHAVEGKTEGRAGSEGRKRKKTQAVTGKS